MFNSSMKILLNVLHNSNIMESLQTNCKYCIDYLSFLCVQDKTSQHVSNGKPITMSKQGRNKIQDTSNDSQKEGIAWFFVMMMTFFLVTYTFHCTWVTSEAYSSPSIVLSARSHDGSRIIFDDFREAYWWLRMNTDEDAKVGGRYGY